MGLVSFAVDGDPVVHTRKLTASDGKTYEVTVTYDSESGIPEDAELAAKEITADDARYAGFVAAAAERLGEMPDTLAFARAFDISLNNPDTGEEYQPAKNVRVSVELLNDDLGTYSGVSVIHFPGEADGAAELVASSVQGETVEFETDGFSVYVLTGEDDSLCTYYFYSYNSLGDYQGYMFYDEQGNQVDSQTIKNGEKLIAPADPPRNPVRPDAEFKGWYVGEDENTLEAEPFDFDVPQSIAPGSREVVYLFAVFADYAYVNYHGQYDAATQTYPVLKTDRIELENGFGSVSLDAVTAPYYNAGGGDAFPEYAFSGWSLTPIEMAGEGEQDKIPDSTLTVVGDTELYPLYKKVHWLSLVSGNSGTGATYYAPVSIAAGETMSEADFRASYVPIRQGYSFRGWYLDVENEGTDAQNGIGTKLTDENGMFCSVADYTVGILADAGEGAYLALSDNVSIYAAWEPALADYTVVVWKQRATDADGLTDGKTYDFAESFRLQAVPYNAVTNPAALTLGDAYRNLNDADSYNSVHAGLEPQITAETNPFKGYMFNAEASDAAKNISFDGTTVFNLKYDKDSTVTPGAGSVSLTFRFIDGADGETDTIIPDLTISAALSSVTPPDPERAAVPGYDFGWYYDPGCTAPVDFDADTMPDHDLTVYGGWTKHWYLVQIDPNKGQMRRDSSNATYFWKTYRSDYVQEYTWVTRDYVESESGSYFYVNHDYAYLQQHEGGRYNYYTQDIAEATDLTTYKHSPGVYIYDGWYQVNADGSETPYAFGRLIEGDTTLRLHWRLAGIYYLQYNADVTVGGERQAGRISEGSAAPSPDGYFDQAEIMLGSGAQAPEGCTFIGWRVRGEDNGRIYRPGETFLLDGEYAVTVNGRKTVYLDAVYTAIETAKIVYDANGGAVSNTADGGYTYRLGNDGEPVQDGDGRPEALSVHTVKRAAGTVTVSGFANNSPILLSSGAGFTYSFTDASAGSGTAEIGEPSGWNTRPDGSGTHYELGAYRDENGKLYYLDTAEPQKLYAEWKIRVYFDKNEGQYPGIAFGTGWEEYTLADDGGAHRGQYYLDTYVGALLPEPTGEVTLSGQAFDFWSTQPDGDQQYVFDFARTRLTGELTLYAHMASMVRVPFHVTTTNKVDRDAWRNTDELRVSASAIDLADASSVNDYVTPAGGGHTYAYACLSDSFGNIISASETAARVVSLYLDPDNENRVTARLGSGETAVLDAEGKDASGRGIYLVYSIENADTCVKLAYMKEGQGDSLFPLGTIAYDGGAFTSLNGSLVTGGILNTATAANGVISGETVSGQILTLTGSPLEISQGLAANVFSAPPLLDDPEDLHGDTLTLVFDSFGVAANGGVSRARKLYLRYYDGRCEWSGDKLSWTVLEEDTLYVVYRQRGYELRVTKAVTIPDSGISPDASFEVTVTSNAITRTSYAAEGTGYAAVSATPATGSRPGSITLSVKDGSDVRISGLAPGDYTITETHNENFEMKAYVDNALAVVTTADGASSFAVAMNEDRRADLKNTPQTICRVRDEGLDQYFYFYTLNQALEYVKHNLDGTAQIELLQDYVMPDWDALEIPVGFEITLTSRTNTAGRYTVFRDETFTSGAMFANYGSFTLSNAVLDGNGEHVRTAGSTTVYNAGVMTVGDRAVLQNAQKNGTGAAIYQERGMLTVEGGAVFADNVGTNGGAIGAVAGTVNISGGSFTGNTAVNGGAIHYSGIQALTVSGGSFAGNRADKGGAIYAASGSVSVSGGSFTGGALPPDEASARCGGAIYSAQAALELSGGAFTGVKAQDNGGAVYAEAGELSLSGAALTNNAAQTGSGGAIYMRAGSISVTAGTLSGNSAALGNGGAIWIGTGTLEFSGGTVGGTESGSANSARNGAGLFVDKGTAYFTGGEITGNTAAYGGAVGVGSEDARLSFSGGVKVTGNTTGGHAGNVYLDQNTDDLITFQGLTSSASVGVCVAASVVDARGVPGARFASYTADANKDRITNDLDPSFQVVSETASKKLYWGKAISVVVRYAANPFASNGFPPGNANQQFKKTVNPYYPVMGEDGSVALSAVAEDLLKNYSIGVSATAAYAGAYLREDPVVSSFEDYFTTLSWNKAEGKWELTRHDGVTKVELGSTTLVIYFAEPAYISIENNTDMTLTVSDIILGGSKSVIDTDSAAGWGMVFAKNGAIRSALLPIHAEDLVLEAGKSVSLLIPGGRNTGYTLTGSFDGGDTVSLRRTNAGGTALESVGDVWSVSAPPFTVTGTTLNKQGTHQLVFGDDKTICKIRTTTVDAASIAAGEIVGSVGIAGTTETEYLFSSLRKAIAFVQAHMQDAPYNKTAVIEMLTDYLLPASDNLAVPQGYDITLTTASVTGVNHYHPSDPQEPRATISRDSENKESMIAGWNSKVGNSAVTTLRISNLIFDGKSVRGTSDGGAVATQYVNVYIDNVDFKNVYASNGGALLVMFEFNRNNTKEVKATMPGTVLVVNHSRFEGCTSTTTVRSNRLGGGAIVTNAETMTLDSCLFDTCTAVDQAGAVFHRVDGNYASYTNITGCRFRNCQANAAGGLELDSKTIVVVDTHFEHCIARDRNGGAFNVWALNNGNPTNDCWTTVIGCSFTDCHVTGSNPGNGGGFRSTSKYTTIIGSNFRNCSSVNGGAVGLSNTNAEQAAIYGGSITGCRASGYGGGIFSSAKTFIIGSEYPVDSENKPVLPNNGQTQVGTESAGSAKIMNCTAAGRGGGVYHERNVSGSSLSVTGAEISGNVSTGGYGGGITVKDVQRATFTGCVISNNSAKGDGGGLWIGGNSSVRDLIVDSTAIRNNTSGGIGGGVYSYAHLTLCRGTAVTGNHITAAPANNEDNAAGAFITNNRVLYVGRDEPGAVDRVVVKNNTNGSGSPSDLRLWWDSANRNDKASSVVVRCSLDDESEIRVVNPGQPASQFGTRNETSFSGFTEGSHVFTSDAGGLYGVANRADLKKLIWRGGVVCKITDSTGHLLYLDPDCKDPAVFDRLDHRTGGSQLSPFSYLRQSSPKLYRKSDAAPRNAIDLTEESICVKLLVSTFETETYIETGNYSRKGVVLTTASSTDDDGYAYTGRAGTSAVIRRAYNEDGKPLITAGVDLTLRNVTLDGGSADKTTPRVSTADGGLVKASAAVTLAANAILQNCRTSGSGAGVYLGTGASLAFAGGAIYNCVSTSGNGGGVCVNTNGKAEFSSGIISQCAAKNGGGVYFRKGQSFDLSGSARITGCEAEEEGGGVCLYAGTVMNMSGGFITGNHAGSAGGGIFLGDADSTRLNLSSRVTVSGNTAEKNGSSCACNVELVRDTNKIIWSKSLARNSLVGVYVPGSMEPDFETYAAAMESDQKTQYHRHGMEEAPFGSFEGNTNYLYCFVNDRNGLKGGLSLGDGEYIHWVRIFSLRVGKTVISDIDYDLGELFTFRVTFSASQNGPGIYGFEHAFTYDDGREDGSGNPEEIRIENGFVEFQLRNGESVTVDNLPAEYNNGHVYYKVEEVLAEDRAAHYTTTTARSSGSPHPTIDRCVAGVIGENLNRNDVDSKYMSTAYFDNLNAVCKLTTSKNGGALLYTWDSVNEKRVPAVYSTLHSDDPSRPGAFDVINAKPEKLYYYNAFTNKYELFNYSGTDTIYVEMLVGSYEMKRPVEVSAGISVGLTTAKANATDGYPYVGTPGTSAEIERTFNDASLFTVKDDTSFTLKNIKLDGNSDSSFTAGANGGLVCVKDDCELTITAGAVLQNSRNSANGGAVYVDNGGSLTLSGSPTIRNNTSADSGKGPAIYLNAGAALYLSGAPVFADNTAQLSGYADKENGHETVYAGNKVRQDIYVTENHEGAPASIIVNGDLTGTGSVWVWEENENHYKEHKPFAALAPGVQFAETPTGTQYDAAHLKAFRNARDDDATENGTDTWLFGTIREDTPGFVCWSGVEGSACVMLVKVAGGSSYQALSGKTFTVYTDSGMSRVAKGKVFADDGTIREQYPLENLTSGPGGAFFIGELAYGTYYVNEYGADGTTVIATCQFTIDDGGVVTVTGSGNAKTITPIKTVDMVNK